MTPAAVRLTSLKKSYGRVVAIDDVSLRVEGGEFFSLLGPSGCGKTTTLRAVAGLIELDAGKIEIMNRDVTGLPVHKRNIGMVFQNYALFPHMTVAANIAFGLRMRGMARGEVSALVERALDLVPPRWNRGTAASPAERGSAATRGVRARRRDRTAAAPAG